MKNHKRLLSLVLTFVMTLSLSIPAFAAVEETGFSDVDAGVWYAEAVIYCREHELMGGIGDNRFAPESSLTRAQLATVLYRIEGEPAVAGTDAFSDTADGAWYSDAVLWASQEEVMGGYGGGRFGPDDPVTREQMTAIPWRYAGSPAADPASLSDADSMASYAVPAVNWAVWLPHLVGRRPCHDCRLPGGERFQRQSRCPILHQFVQPHRQQPAYLPGTGFRCDYRGWIDRQQ